MSSPGIQKRCWKSIEDYESIERTLTKAKKRGWVPDEVVIREIREDIEKQKEYMTGKGYPQSDIDNEIAWRDRVWQKLFSVFANPSLK